MTSKARTVRLYADLHGSRSLCASLHFDLDLSKCSISGTTLYTNCLIREKFICLRCLGHFTDWHVFFQLTQVEVRTPVLDHRQGYRGLLSGS